MRADLPLPRLLLASLALLLLVDRLVAKPARAGSLEESFVTIEVECADGPVTLRGPGPSGQGECQGMPSDDVTLSASGFVSSNQSAFASATVDVNPDSFAQGFANGFALGTYKWRIITRLEDPPVSLPTLPVDIIFSMSTSCSPGVCNGVAVVVAHGLNLLVNESGRPNRSFIVKEKLPPFSEVQVNIQARCPVRAGFGFPWFSFTCRASVDPSIELDQETFDAEMGDDTFPLDRYYRIEFSDGVRNPERIVEEFDPHPLQSDAIGLPDPANPGMTLYRVSTTGGAAATDPTVASASGPLASGAQLVEENANRYWVLGSQAGAPGSSYATDGFVLRGEAPGGGGDSSGGSLAEFFATPRDLSEFRVQAQVREATANGATQLRMLLRDIAGVEVVSIGVALTQDFAFFDYSASLEFSAPAGAPAVVFDVSRVQAIGFEFFADSAQDAPAFEFHVDDVALIPEPALAAQCAAVLATLGVLAMWRRRTPGQKAANGAFDSAG